MKATCPNLFCRRPRTPPSHEVIGCNSALKWCHMLWCSQNRAAVLVQIPAWTKIPVSRDFQLLCGGSWEISTSFTLQSVHNVINPQRVKKLSAAFLYVNQVLFFFLVCWYVGFFPFNINTGKTVSFSLFYYLCLSSVSFQILSKKAFFLPPCKCVCLGISKMKLAFLGLGL